MLTKQILPSCWVGNQISKVNCRYIPCTTLHCLIFRAFVLPTAFALFACFHLSHFQMLGVNQAVQRLAPGSTSKQAGWWSYVIIINYWELEDCFEECRRFEQASSFHIQDIHESVLRIPACRILWNLSIEFKPELKSGWLIPNLYSFIFSPFPACQMGTRIPEGPVPQTCVARCRPWNAPFFIPQLVSLCFHVFVFF